MNTYTYISSVEAAGSAVVLIFALIAGLKIRDQGVVSSRWNYILVMITFLFIGLIGFAVLQLLRIPYAKELMTGGVFLLCTCIIFSFITFTKTSSYHFQMERASQKQDGDKLKTLYGNDELTGLYSRNAFLTLMSNHMKIVSRQRKKVLVFYADVDNLKQINETLGYQEGDLMLIETANILRDAFRKSDIIARIADDEFAVFLVGASDDTSDAIASNFLETLGTHNSKRLPKYQLSITYGILSFDPQYNDSIDSVLKEAYKIVKENKALKRNLPCEPCDC